MGASPLAHVAGDEVRKPQTPAAIASSVLRRSCA